MSVSMDSPGACSVRKGAPLLARWRGCRLGSPFSDPPEEGCSGRQGVQADDLERGSFAVALAARQAWHRGWARICQAPGQAGRWAAPLYPPGSAHLTPPVPRVSPSLHQPGAGEGGCVTQGPKHLKGVFEWSEQRDGELRMGHSWQPNPGVRNAQGLLLASSSDSPAPWKES